MKNKISTRIKIAYSLPAFALAVVGIPVYVYLPKFYTDIVGVNISLVGIILFSVRIFDAVTDPAVGLISDRIKSRFGRRRPFIALGSILVAAFIFLLFNPPDFNPMVNTIWFGISVYGLFFFWTLVVVPYESLGPEITFDYNERTTLFLIRDGMLIAGTLFAAVSPVLTRMISGLEESAVGERSLFFWLSILYGPMVIASCWWCVRLVQEKAGSSKWLHPHYSRSIKTMLQNKPFLILLCSYTISAIGSNLPATLILYYVEYVLHSQLAEIFLILYLATGVIFLPMWWKLAHRFGKKNAWLASMVVNTGAFTGVFFLGPGDELLYGLLVVISGLGFGASLALPSALQADVIDYDELLTGARREGQYIGMWSIFKKLAAAVGVGAGLLFLGGAGYAPNEQQPESVILTLRFMYAGAPSICNIAAFLIALYYPISEMKHKTIRKQIDERNSGKEVCDPLLNPAC